MQPSAVIPAFDAYLAERGLRFDAVIIGGAALELLGTIQRGTDDCDVLDPSIPAAIQEAAREFACGRHGLHPEWFNSKAHDFVGVAGCLPEGWRSRLREVLVGRALHLRTLGDFDLLCTKLVALIDRGRDYADCVAMAPSLEQLQRAWPFIVQYEGNEESRLVYWIPAARRQLERLAKELGHDVVF